MAQDLSWKDTLLAGGSRTPIPYTGQPAPAGYALDLFHRSFEPSTAAGPVYRNDWVAGPGGRPVISGSSESQVGAGAPAPVPSPGFQPVSPGLYGGQAFLGRNVGGLGSLSAPELLGLYRSLVGLANGPGLVEAGLLPEFRRRGLNFPS